MRSTASRADCWRWLRGWIKPHESVGSAAILKCRALRPLQTGVTAVDPNASSQRFDKIASNFATSEVHTMSPTIKRLHEVLGGGKFGSICDVACGAGHLALSFAGRAGRIVGVDPAPNMLEALRRLATQRGVVVETVE